MLLRLKFCYQVMLELSVNQFFNQSIVQKCNRHWSGHQGRMQSLLTGARKAILMQQMTIPNKKSS